MIAIPLSTSSTDRRWRWVTHVKLRRFYAFQFTKEIAFIPKKWLIVECWSSSWCWCEFVRERKLWPGTVYRAARDQDVFVSVENHPCNKLAPSKKFLHSPTMIDGNSAEKDFCLRLTYVARYFVLPSWTLRGQFYLFLWKLFDWQGTPHGVVTSHKDNPQFSPFANCKATKFTFKNSAQLRWHLSNSSYFTFKRYYEMFIKSSYNWTELNKISSKKEPARRKKRKGCKEIMVLNCTTRTR